MTLVIALLLIAPTGEEMRIAGPWYGTSIARCIETAAPLYKPAREAGLRLTCRATSRHPA